MINISEIDEKELASLCADGNSAARKELYSRYAARLSSFCSRYSNGPIEGTDIMHDTMIRALQKIHQFRYQGRGSLYSWLTRIAVNMAIDRLRKDNKLEVSALGEEMSNVVIPEIDEVRHIPLPVLQQFISRLPDSNRIVFNMFCIDGFSHKEIAEILGIREKSSSSSLAKAKKMLANMIKAYYENNR